MKLALSALNRNVKCLDLSVNNVYLKMCTDMEKTIMITSKTHPTLRIKLSQTLKSFMQNQSSLKRKWTKY